MDGRPETKPDVTCPARKAGKENFPRRLARIGLVFALFLLGVALGRVWGSFSLSSGSPRSNPEIPGHLKGLLNPLVEGQDREYSSGRMLRPFEDDLRKLAGLLEEEGWVSEISIFFRDLQNGPWFGIEEDRTFTPGSLLKVPVVMAFLRQAEQHPELLEQEVRFPGFSGDPWPSTHLAMDPLVPGRSYSLRDLVHRTLAFSDNHAFALVGEAVDPKVLKSLLRDLGLPEELADDPTMPAALSPRGYRQLFRTLYNASYLNAEMSALLLGSFAASTFKDGLEAGVPPGTRVAHKFGIYSCDASGEGDEWHLHDCGIVYAPDRPYYLSVMTSGADTRRLANAIAQVSRFVYNEIERQARLRKSGGSP